MGTAGTPRTATPRGRSFLKVLSEQQHLQKELAAEKAAREAADARALVSADEAAAAVGMLTVISIPVLAYLHAYNTYQAMVLLVECFVQISLHAPYILPAFSAGTGAIMLPDSQIYLAGTSVSYQHSLQGRA